MPAEMFASGPAGLISRNGTLVHERAVGSGEQSVRWSKGAVE